MDEHQGRDGSASQQLAEAKKWVSVSLALSETSTAARAYDKLVQLRRRVDGRAGSGTRSAERCLAAE